MVRILLAFICTITSGLVWAGGNTSSFGHDSDVCLPQYRNQTFGSNLPWWGLHYYQAKDLGLNLFIGPPAPVSYVEPVSEEPSTLLFLPAYPGQMPDDGPLFGPEMQSDPTDITPDVDYNQAVGTPHWDPVAIAGFYYLLAQGNSTSSMSTGLKTGRKAARFISSAITAMNEVKDVIPVEVAALVHVVAGVLTPGDAYMEETKVTKRLNSALTAYNQWMDEQVDPRDHRRTYDLKRTQSLLKGEVEKRKHKVQRASGKTTAKAVQGLTDIGLSVQSIREKWDGEPVQHTT